MTVDDVDMHFDDEFRRLCRTLTAEEIRTLNEEVQRDGRFLDPVVVWQEEGLLLDGHNRMDVWAALPEDTPVPPPRVEYVSLPDRDAAKRWIIRHQLGRRNLTLEQAVRLREEIGRQYNTRKRTTGKPQVVDTQANSNGDTVSPLGLTADQIADESGTNKRTVYRAAKLQEALAAIESLDSVAADDIRAGALKVSDKQVAAIASVSPSVARRTIAQLRDDVPWKNTAAGKATTPVTPPGTMQRKSVDEYLRRLGTALDEYAEAVQDVDGPCHKSVKKSLEGLVKLWGAWV